MQAINHEFGCICPVSDGRNERPLVAGFGSSYNPSFSPDAHWIIFTSERYGRQMSSGCILTARASSG